MDVRRGQIVLVALSGDFGKPRPAVVVQSDLLNAGHTTVSVCLMTSDCVDAQAFRVTVEPSPENGLRLKSQIMVDKIMTLPRLKVRKIAGAASTASMAELDAALRWTLGLA